MYAIRGKEERRGMQVCARFGIFGNFLLSRGGEISLDSNRGFPSRWMSKFGSSRCDRATPWILKMWGKGKRRGKVVTSLRENGSGKGKRKKEERI